MNYFSVCSGIEAASVAWKPLGWRPVAFSEIDPFACAVLAHRYPETPNWGDMTRYQEWPDAEIDLLVGGTPCQSFSVAGLRGGMADPRGNLALVFLGVAARYRPRWIVWENVPGVLSSNGGRDFGAFLGGLVELGYGFAYRVLDAQYYGVPQRRRRVFVVGYLGDWRRAAAVLFEPSSLRRNPAPGRATGEKVAPRLASRARGGGLGTDAELDGALIAHTLKADGFDASEDGTGRGLPLVAVVFDETQITNKDNRANPKPGDPSHPLAATSRPPAIAFQANASASQSMNPSPTTPSLDVGKAGAVSILSASSVRRMTPLETERLQGLPDDWTLIPYRGKPAKDGPRYKAVGNSMAVPVLVWTGKRIALEDVS